MILADLGIMTFFVHVSNALLLYWLIMVYVLWCDCQDAIKLECLTPGVARSCVSFNSATWYEISQRGSQNWNCYNVSKQTLCFVFAFIVLLFCLGHIINNFVNKTKKRYNNKKMNSKMFLFFFM